MKKYFSFPSFKRVKHKKEFQYLFQKSFRIYGGFFIYRIVFSKKSYSKLGVITSKKFGNAVYRNHIKRIVRDEFRHHDFLYHITILASQSRPIIDNDVKARKELKKVFALLSDKYYLLQNSLDDVSLKTAQKTVSMSLLATLSFYLVFAYKKWFSSSLQDACRFTPTCSIYAIESFRVHGFLKGWLLTTKRIFSCRPGGSSGYDPVPRKKR